MDWGAGAIGIASGLWAAAVGVEREVYAAWRMSTLGDPTRNVMTADDADADIWRSIFFDASASGVLDNFPRTVFRPEPFF